MSSFVFSCFWWYIISLKSLRKANTTPPAPKKFQIDGVFLGFFFWFFFGFFFPRKVITYYSSWGRFRGVLFVYFCFRQKKTQKCLSFLTEKRSGFPIPCQDEYISVCILNAVWIHIIFFFIVSFINEHSDTLVIGSLCN